jgi:hypothetical protein
MKFDMKREIRYRCHHVDNGLRAANRRLESIVAAEVVSSRPEPLDLGRQHPRLVGAARPLVFSSRLQSRREFLI